MYKKLNILNTYNKKQLVLNIEQNIEYNKSQREKEISLKYCLASAPEIPFVFQKVNVNEYGHAPEVRDFKRCMCIQTASALFKYLPCFISSCLKA